MIQIIEKKLDVKTYLSLREKVNWRALSERQAQMALDNALYMVCAYDGDTPVGMGRIVGDGAVICYVQDLVVIPEYQGKQVGSMLIEKLKEYVESITEPGTRMMMCLMCAKGREEFYLKHDFVARPTDALGPGMIRYIDA